MPVIKSCLLKRGGSDGFTEGIRRVLHARLIALRPDHETLEDVEAGTWIPVSAAHRDLTQILSIPEAAPYRFPAITELSHLSPVSDALVGRCRWDSPAVETNKRLILGSNTNDLQSWLTTWRENATMKVIEAFQIVKAYEQSAFGEKFFLLSQSPSRWRTIPGDPR